MHRAAWAIAVSVAAGPLAACGGGTPGARSPDHPLPPYTGHAVDLFDDAIEPGAVGYPADQGVNPAGDARLRERTQTGDAVVLARVTTVTSKSEDRGRSWQLGLHTVERLAGAGPLDADFVLTVAPADAASGVVQGFEGRLIGKRFVAFVREFARPGAPPEEAGDLRFHLAPDSDAELGAVKAATRAESVR